MASFLTLPSSRVHGKDVETLSAASSTVTLVTIDDASERNLVVGEKHCSTITINSCPSDTEGGRHDEFVRVNPLTRQYRLKLLMY